MYLHFFIHISQCLKLSFLDILAQCTLFVEEKMYSTQKPTPPHNWGKSTLLQSNPNLTKHSSLTFSLQETAKTIKLRTTQYSVLANVIPMRLPLKLLCKSREITFCVAFTIYWILGNSCFPKYLWQNHLVVESCCFIPV